MARRAGKAASRKARQRNTARSQRPTAPAPPSAPPSPDTVADADTSAVAIPPVGTPDARAARSLNPPTRRTVAASVFGSTLTDRERSEYHYVERDLRNIGVLTAIMVALLLLAWVVFRVLGLLG
jgi:hypothetical protein